VDAEDEHPASSLRHSEVLSVENPVGPEKPELPQRTEERPKVPAAMTGEKSRHVFEENGGRSISLHKVEEGVGEAGSRPCKPSPLAGDGEVLAGEPARPEGGVVPVEISVSAPSPLGLL
jgi:hypothetical protein